jgi:hypothetical protein
MTITSDSFTQANGQLSSTNWHVLVGTDPNNDGFPTVWSVSGTLPIVSSNAIVSSDALTPGDVSAGGFHKTIATTDDFTLSLSISFDITNSGDGHFLSGGFVFRVPATPSFPATTTPGNLAFVQISTSGTAYFLTAIAGANGYATWDMTPGSNDFLDPAWWATPRTLTLTAEEFHLLLKVGTETLVDYTGNDVDDPPLADSTAGFFTSHIENTDGSAGTATIDNFSATTGAVASTGWIQAIGVIVDLALDSVSLGSPNVVLNKTFTQANGPLAAADPDWVTFASDAGSSANIAPSSTEPEVFNNAISTSLAAANANFVDDILAHVSGAMSTTGIKSVPHFSVEATISATLADATFLNPDLWVGQGRFERSADLSLICLAAAPQFGPWVPPVEFGVELIVTHNYIGQLIAPPHNIVETKSVLVQLNGVSGGSVILPSAMQAISWWETPRVVKLEVSGANVRLFIGGTMVGTGTALTSAITGLYSGWLAHTRLVLQDNTLYGPIKVLVPEPVTITLDDFVYTELP